MNFRRQLSIFVGLLLAALSWGVGYDAQATAPAQTVADHLREAASADAAFVATGLLKPTFERSDLSSMLQYPTDEVSIVTLTGAQVRLALERSISLHPTPNSAFLQLSGLEVTYSKSAPADKRITEVLIGTVKLQDDKTYKVAMPGALARGGLGYFKVWKRENITKTLDKVTLESLLKGKAAVELASRWKEAP
jgi:2',3'-cyclic-nucleotide 2'-phosphodiesterase (5'-nucleotidase family)